MTIKRFEYSTEEPAHIQLAKLFRSMTWAELTGFAEELHHDISNHPITSVFDLAARLNGWAESLIQHQEHTIAKGQTND